MASPTMCSDDGPRIIHVFINSNGMLRSASVGRLHGYARTVGPGPEPRHIRQACTVVVLCRGALLTAAPGDEVPVGAVVQET